MCIKAGTMTSSVALEDSSAESVSFLVIPPREVNKGSDWSSIHEKPKWGLLDYDSLPEFLKHNEFILSYYRSEWPLKQTLLSIFSIHNETLNIWTHLIGFFIFLILTAYAGSVFPIDLGHSGQLAANNSSSTFFPFQTTSNHGTAEQAKEAPPVLRWPFYLYCVGAMFCLLMSSACHLLSCHSARTCYLVLRLDYAGISALIVSSFYPPVYYSFACRPFFLHVYLVSITAFGAAAVAVSLLPAFETPRFQPARVVLFACMGLSGLVPIAHKMVAFGHRPEAKLTTGYEVAMGTFYGLGLFFYSMRVPERWSPGKFDIAGHSHQLFHVLVIAGAYTHYLANLVYLAWRELEGC